VARLLVPLLLDRASAELDLLVALGQFGEGEDAGLVGVDQALYLALDLGHTAAQVIELRGPFVCAQPAVTCPAEGLVEHRRISEDAADILPDDGIEALRRQLPSPARLAPAPHRERIHALAAVIGVAPVGPDVVGKPHCVQLRSRRSRYSPPVFRMAHCSLRPSRSWASANRSSETTAGTATPSRPSFGRRRQDSPPAPFGSRPVRGCRRLAGTDCFWLP
jgi:hypothetical protein